MSRKAKAPTTTQTYENGLLLGRRELAREVEAAYHDTHTERNGAFLSKLRFMGRMGYDEQDVQTNATLVKNSGLSQADKTQLLRALYLTPDLNPHAFKVEVERKAEVADDASGAAPMEEAAGESEAAGAAAPAPPPPPAPVPPPPPESTASPAAGGGGLLGRVMAFAGR